MDFFKLDRFGDNLVAMAILFVIYTALRLIEFIYKHKKSDADIWLEIVKENTSAITSLKDSLAVLPAIHDFLIELKGKRIKK